MNQLFLFRKNMTPIRKLLLMKMFAGGVPISEYTATGNPLTFNTNVAKPLKSLVLPWTPVQSGTGDPSPENVRSISGVSSLAVSHSGQDTSDPTTYPIVFPALGKNLFDKSKATTGVWWKGKVLTGGTYGDYSASDYIPVTAGQTYTLTRDVSGQGAVCYFDSEKTYVSQETWDQYRPSHQIPADIAYITFTTLTTGLDAAQFEKGNSATSYEPYTNTVYGGSLDVVSGVLTVEWAEQILDGTDGYNWSYAAQTSTSRFSITTSVFKNGKAKDSGDCLFNYFNFSTSSSEWNGRIGNTGNLLLYVPSSITTREELRSYFSEHTLQVVYELETAKTWQLDAHTITALLGDNVIWSDTNGTNTAVYLKKG